MPADEVKQAYREAYETWQRQLEALHAFLLDGRPPATGVDLPAAIKGLLNREDRAKRRYDEARRRLLGVEDHA
jgi:cytidylate kinase